MSGVKYWDGDSWETLPAITYWDGDSWETPVAKWWNGSEWKTFGASAPPAGTINALDYAEGDGVTDDTSALTAAANAAIAAGKSLYIPAATYKITNWAPPADLTAFGDGSASWLMGKLRWRGGQSWSRLLIGSTTTSALGPYYSTGTWTHEDVSFTACKFRGGGSGNATLVVPAQGYGSQAIVLRNTTFTQCEWECNHQTTYAPSAQDISWFLRREFGDITDGVTFDRCHFGTLNSQGRTGGAYGGIVFWTSHYPDYDYADVGDKEQGYYDNITFDGCIWERADIWNLDLAGPEYAPAAFTECSTTIRNCIFKGLSGLYRPEYEVRVVAQTEPGFDCVIEDNVFGIGDTNAWKFVKGTARSTLKDNIFDYRTYAYDTVSGGGDDGEYQIDALYAINTIIRCESAESNLTISGNQLLLPTGKYTGLGQQGWIYDPSNRATKTGNTVSWGSGSGPLANY